MSQEVYFGTEGVTRLQELFRRNFLSKVFLVTGKRSFEGSGAKDFIENCIAPFSPELIRFYDFEVNPNIEDLLSGLKKIEEFKPDVIIAIGGGSVIDMGKLLRFFYTHDGEIFSGKYKSKGIELPLIAIPTTAGTGSEATHFAVLYDENKVKHSIADQGILPDYAIVNSELTWNQSSYLTACAGFDALAQGIEAYWNKNATEESDEYALKSIDLIYETLPKVVANPTPELRSRMSEGAFWAGKAINITKTTAPHAFSYPFTSHYGIPHGHAVALTFPYIAYYNFTKGKMFASKKKIIAKLFNASDNIFSHLKNYVNSINLRTPAKNYDVDLILSEISLERLVNNPAEINYAEAIDIIRKSVT